MSNENENITSLANFKDVKPGDFRAGIRKYSTIARQIQASEGAVSAWLFREAIAIWETNHKMATVSLEKFTEYLEAEVAFIISDKAGGAQLEPKLAKLKGNNALANAYKKIKNGLEANLDLLAFSSVSALAKEVSNINKEKKEAEKKVNIVSEIKDAALACAIAEGIDTSTMEGMAWVAKKVQELTAEYAKNNSPPANDSPVTYVGVKSTHKVPEHLEDKASKVVEAIERMKAEAIHLLIERTALGSEDRAFEQLITAIEATTKKWYENALKLNAKKLAMDAQKESDLDSVDIDDGMDDEGQAA